MPGPFIWGPAGPINLDAPAAGILTSDSNGNVTSTATTGSGNVVLATAPTMTNPVVGTQATTDNSTKAASTAYVTTAITNAIAGVNPAVAVQAATTAAGDTSGFTYNNGVGGIGATFTGSTNTAVTIDGFTFTALGQRLLVKNDTQSPSGAFNGIYYVTQLQTALLPPILTRALDYDQPSDINNTGAIPVINGTVNSTTSWLLTSAVNTIGTDPLTYVKFSVNPSTILTNPMTTAGDMIYGGASGAPTRMPNGTSGQVPVSAGSTVGFSTLPGNSTALKAPTRQSFTSGSGTYTTPTSPGPLYIVVEMVGGGGGGGGGGAAAGGGAAGTVGNNTTFNSTLLVAGGGGAGGGDGTNGGSGGANSNTAGPLIVINSVGAMGGSSFRNPSAAYFFPGGLGGSSALAGGGGGGLNSTGSNGGTNTGGGGGGGSSASSNTAPCGSGGGGGGYLKAIINSPAASYTYSIGGTAAGGTATGAGFNGGAGAAGYLVVTEHYQ